MSLPEIPEEQRHRWQEKHGLGGGWTCDRCKKPAAECYGRERYYCGGYPERAIIVPSGWRRRGAMRRRFTAPPARFRCVQDIQLRDGSGAQCQRSREKGRRYCWQHGRCDVPGCRISGYHVHCPECGSIEHRADGCDMED